MSAERKIIVVNLRKHKKRRPTDAFFLYYVKQQNASDQFTVNLKLPAQRFVYRAFIRNPQ